MTADLRDRIEQGDLHFLDGLVLLGTIASQRWFGGKSRDVLDARVLDAGVVPGDAPLLAFALFGMTRPLPEQPAVRTIFADEFSGSELNRAHWNVIVTGRTATVSSVPTTNTNCPWAAGPVAPIHRRSPRAVPASPSEA